MSKTVSGLLSHCRQALNNKVMYVYGAKMQVLTRQQILSLQKRHGKSCVWDSDLKKAGHLCCDCSGLISSYTGITRGSSQYKATATECITIAELKKNWSKYIGWGLWLKGHIGVVSDKEGYYFAMDGSARNMVHYPLSKQKWVYAIKLRDIDYSSPKVKEVDDKVITSGKAIVNGREYKVAKILKNGLNFIMASNFENMGFNVGYNANTKAIIIDNEVKELPIIVDGESTSVEAINIKGHNFVPIRSIAAAIGANIDFVDGITVIKTRKE